LLSNLSVLSVVSAVRNRISRGCDLLAPVSRNRITRKANTDEPVHLAEGFTSARTFSAALAVAAFYLPDDIAFARCLIAIGQAIEEQHHQSERET
jgi:hypothetical protein